MIVMVEEYFIHQLDDDCNYCLYTVTIFLPCTELSVRKLKTHLDDIFCNLMFFVSHIVEGLISGVGPGLCDLS